VDKIQKDRFEAIRKIQTYYGGCTILKGAGSLILGEGKKRLLYANMGILVWPVVEWKMYYLE